MLSSSAKQRQERPHFDILLIEDDEDTRDILIECIETQSSFHVQPLSSGEEVLQHLQEIRESAPRLFIIDYLLPGMTGLQLCDHLRALDDFEEVPAILLTAAHVTQGIQSAIAERGLSLFSKPFELAELLDYIEHTLLSPPQLI